MVEVYRKNKKVNVNNTFSYLR